MEAGKYDCVVVGGGVAGLMTASRLSEAGASVALLESELLGSGATTRNHGMVHGGALYARWHPEIVAACSQAQTAYRKSFPDAVTGSAACWYIGSATTVDTYDKLWRSFGIAHSAVDDDELAELLNMVDGARTSARAVQELLIDTGELIADLARRCLRGGVRLLVGARALQVVTAHGAVRGVRTALGVVEAANVVLCSGIGTRDILESSGSVVAGELRSRLETMMAFPGDLPRAIIGLEFGWPAVAPSACGGVVLASRYGAPQRFVDGPARWPVPADENARLVRDLAERLKPGRVDLSGGVGWVCSKTEHVRGSGDQWGTEPDYAVIDHRQRDGVAGWWTVLPGKMTLALHASRAVAAAVTATEPALELEARASGRLDITGLIDVTPWGAHTRAGAQ
ncbi:NAD(P)/FAD-dependent oxidoreductase [Nocardia sp. NPDC057227]|uniref:NAD(P)/FAD-dependent oxidoreductase n=1 Tax=Nocardia sp. NPDC057227 TaxID=3346056 RepID=UPI003628DAFF